MPHTAHAHHRDATKHGNTNLPASESDETASAATTTHKASVDLIFPRIKRGVGLVVSIQVDYCGYKKITLLSVQNLHKS